MGGKIPARFTFHKYPKPSSPLSHPAASPESEAILVRKLCTGTPDAAAAYTSPAGIVRDQRQRTGDASGISPIALPGMHGQCLGGEFGRGRDCCRGGVFENTWHQLSPAFFFGYPVLNGCGTLFFWLFLPHEGSSEEFCRRSPPGTTREFPINHRLPALPNQIRSAAMIPNHGELRRYQRPG